jgi:hypothetical protein
MGFTGLLVPMLVGSSLMLIVSGFYLPDKMREYDHRLLINTDFYLPMREENRIWFSDGMSMEFNPSDIRIWTTVRPIKRNGWSWLPRFDDLEVKLLYAQKPDIHAPVPGEMYLDGRDLGGIRIQGKDPRDPLVELDRIHGKVDAWRNLVQREIDGVHQVIICPSWQKRLIYHIAEPDNFLFNYLRVKFGDEISSGRLQDAEQLLLKVPEREWDAFEAAIKKEGFTNGDEFLRELRLGASGRTSRALESLRRSLDSLERTWIAYYMMYPDGIIENYLRKTGETGAVPGKTMDLALKIMKTPEDSKKTPERTWKPVLENLSGIGLKKLGDIVDVLGKPGRKDRDKVLAALSAFAETTFTGQSKKAPPAPAASPAPAPAEPAVKEDAYILDYADGAAMSAADTFWPYLNDMLSEKAVANDLFAATVSSCLKKKVVFAFEAGVGGAYSSRVNAVMETLESVKKDPRYRGLLDNNLVVFSAVPDNLASKVEEHLQEGAVVFTFARLDQQAKLASVESRVIPSYVDIPDDFPMDAYVPIPEIAAIALGKYLGICDPSKMPADMLSEINIAGIKPLDRTLIFRLLPKPLQIDTEEESVRRYALLKQFLSAV